jgi:hypothetical protein
MIQPNSAGTRSGPLRLLEAPASQVRVSEGRARLVREMPFDGPRRFIGHDECVFPARRPIYMCDGYPYQPLPCE